MPGLRSTALPTPPLLVRDFIAGLPPGVGTLLFAITTAGYAAGDMAWYAVKPLRDKGYRPFVLANVLVANNLRLPFLSPLPIPSSEEMAPKLERAAAKARQLAGSIHRRERHVEGTGLAGRLLGVSQRLGAAHWPSGASSPTRPAPAVAGAWITARSTTSR